MPTIKSVADYHADVEPHPIIEAIKADGWEVEERTEEPSVGYFITARRSGRALSVFGKIEDRDKLLDELAWKVAAVG